MTESRDRVNGPRTEQDQERPLAIVIVTYNSGRVVGGCLDSLDAALGKLHARVIVVDNASQDDTLAVVAERMPTAEVIARTSNDGFAAGVNTGADAALGSDVLVLNPDIQLAPGCVPLLREEMNTSGAGIAVPALMDSSGRRSHSLRRRPTVLRALGEAVLGGTRAGRIPLLGELVISPRVYRRAGTAAWATGAAWLISRQCLAVVGPLDERYFLYSEETEYMLRAVKNGLRVQYQPRAVAVHLSGEQKTSPRLWALSATNRVRLHREREGRFAAAAMWAAVVLNELIRAAVGPRSDQDRHVAALKSLVGMRRWPTPPDQRPDYVLFAGQDWWYHNRSHSDFQLLRSVAACRRVLVVNSIGLRMPLPGRSTQVLRRILRKFRSVAMLVRRPDPRLPGFYVMSPLPLPFYSARWTRWLNAVLVRLQVRLVCLALGIDAPIIVITLPTALDVVRPMRRHALVYNRSDRHSAFVESDAAAIRSLERSALRSADHVLYVSNALLDEERPLTGDRAYFLDHGIDLEHFRPRGTGDAPADLAAIPSPRVGFFGALDDQVVDFELLERVAAELPEASLVLIGNATRPMDSLTQYPNVYWLGFRPYERIPDYGLNFDVALMPWLNSEWIRYSNPIKLKEYLALGLPVVSTDFAEVTHYRRFVRVAADHAHFVDLVRQTLRDGGSEDPATRRACASTASWAACADQLIALAEGSSRPPSSRGEFHPPALTDPYVTVSRHTALVVLVTRPWGRR